MRIVVNQGRTHRDNLTEVLRHQLSKLQQHRQTGLTCLCDCTSSVISSVDIGNGHLYGHKPEKCASLTGSFDMAPISQ